MFYKHHSSLLLFQIIYICRNPKAACLSYYKLLKYLGSPQASSLRGCFEMFLKGYDGRE